jgi:hypothetical protein
MATNKRIFYATQAFSLTPVDVTGDSIDVGTAYYPGGVQSLGMNTNFNLEKLYQLGQLDLYEAVDNNPQIEFTINKIFDGTLPLFLLTMGGADHSTGTSLVKGQNNRVNLTLGIWKDTGDNDGNAGTHAGVDSINTLSATGLYASNFTFTFPADGNATEETTLVGNHKEWGAGSIDGWEFDPEDPTATIHSKGITRRYKFNTADGKLVMPTGMPSGSPLSNVTVSFDLGREPIYTLGNYEPYLRYVNFPVEVTTEITTVAMDLDIGETYNLSPDAYNCSSSGSSVTNNETIKFVICADQGEELEIDLGDANRLQSVNYTGGDTGGGNVQVSYSYTNSSSFKMTPAGSWGLDAKGS